MLNEFYLYRSLLSEGLQSNNGDNICAISYRLPRLGKANNPVLVSRLILRGELFPFDGKPSYWGLSKGEQAKRLQEAKTALLCFLGESKAKEEHSRDKRYANYFVKEGKKLYSGLEYLAYRYGRDKKADLFGHDGKFCLNDSFAQRLADKNRHYFGKGTSRYSDQYEMDSWSMDLLISDALGEGPFRRIGYSYNPNEIRTFYQRIRRDTNPALSFLCAVYLKARLQEFDLPYAFIKDDEWCTVIQSSNRKKSKEEDPLQSYWQNPEDENAPIFTKRNINLSGKAVSYVLSDELSKLFTVYVYKDELEHSENAGGRVYRDSLDIRKDRLEIIKELGGVK